MAPRPRVIFESDPANAMHYLVVRIAHASYSLMSYVMTSTHRTDVLDLCKVCNSLGLVRTGLSWGPSVYSCER